MEYSEQQILIFVIGGLMTYMAIGLTIAWRYGKRASVAFLAANGRLPHEAALGVVQGCVWVAWPVMAPYAWFTNFRSWEKKVE